MFGNLTCLAFKHVYKVVAKMCLEKCFIPKHSFYSVEKKRKIEKGKVGKGGND